MSRPRAPDAGNAMDRVGDPARLSTLRRLNLLDTPADRSFDRISRLATRILDVPIALPAAA